MFMLAEITSWPQAFANFGAAMAVAVIGYSLFKAIGGGWSK